MGDADWNFQATFGRLESARWPNHTIFFLDKLGRQWEDFSQHFVNWGRQAEVVAWRCGIGTKDLPKQIDKQVVDGVRFIHAVCRRLSFPCVFYCDI